MTIFNIALSVLAISVSGKNFTGNNLRTKQASNLLQEAQKRQLSENSQDNSIYINMNGGDYRRFQIQKAQDGDALVWNCDQGMVKFFPQIRNEKKQISVDVPGQTAIFYENFNLPYENNDGNVIDLKVGGITGCEELFKSSTLEAEVSEGSGVTLPFNVTGTPIPIAYGPQYKLGQIFQLDVNGLSEDSSFSAECLGHNDPLNPGEIYVPLQINYDSSTGLLSSTYTERTEDYTIGNIKSISVSSSVANNFSIAGIPSDCVFSTTLGVSINKYPLVVSESTSNLASTSSPSSKPTAEVTSFPTSSPSSKPVVFTFFPTSTPTSSPSSKPVVFTFFPTSTSTSSPTVAQTSTPTLIAVMNNPTNKPTEAGTMEETSSPTSRVTTNDDYLRDDFHPVANDTSPEYNSTLPVNNDGLKNENSVMMPILVVLGTMLSLGGLVLFFAYNLHQSKNDSKKVYIENNSVKPNELDDSVSFNEKFKFTQEEKEEKRNFGDLDV